MQNGQPISSLHWSRSPRRRRRSANEHARPFLPWGRPMKVESSAHRGRAAVGLLLTLFLAGCGAGGWFGESDDPPLPGERISVLSDGRSLAADPRAADLPVALPRAIANEEWRQAGATPDHAPQHLALPESVSLAWSRSIGSGASRERRYLS